jgi:hypothetical protein
MIAWLNLPESCFWGTIGSGRNIFGEKQCM